TCGPNRVVDAAVFERLHHQLETVWRRRDLERYGPQQFNFPCRQSLCSQLVLQSTNSVIVGGAILEMAWHQIKSEPRRAFRRAIRARGGNCQPAVGIAGKPLQSTQEKAPTDLTRFNHGRGRVRRSSYSRRGAYIAAPVLLGDPRAARLGQAVHADDVMQEALTKALGRMRTQHIGHSSGKRNWTMQAD